MAHKAYVVVFAQKNSHGSLTSSATLGYILTKPRLLSVQLVALGLAGKTSWKTIEGELTVCSLCLYATYRDVGPSTSGGEASASIRVANILLDFQCYGVCKCVKLRSIMDKF